MQCITGADPGIFDWVGGGGGGGSNFVSEKTVELFCGKLLLPQNPHTPTPPHLHTPSYQMWLPINFLGQLKSRRIHVHCTAVLLIG